MYNYIQLGRTMAGSIQPNSEVLFDSLIMNDGSQISYNQETGHFTFGVGTYHINWFVTQMTGLSTNGSNYIFTPLPLPVGNSPSAGSNHIKISSTSGTQIISIQTDAQRIQEYALVNISDDAAVLSDIVLSKAGITIHQIVDPTTILESIPKGHLYSQNPKGGRLSIGSSVNFSAENSVNLKDGLGIVNFGGYADRFYLNQSGLYLVNYEIVIGASDTNHVIEFRALDTTNSQTLHIARGVSPLGTIVGNFQIVKPMIPLTATHFTIQEVGGDNVDFSEASITITQITRYAPRYQDDAGDVGTDG
ncbi:MAG: hypothetical protein LBU60_06515 [Clostridiales bacterium]|jgi:hypothetical protein|nr:hypothetical protein [Clostridiales bacterium]